MAPRGIHTALIAALGAVLLISSASAQSNSCTSAVISLSSCLTYISGNDTTPSSSCCQNLATVVQSEPKCLCTLLNGGGSALGITINQTKALALPSACKVQTPPISRCNGNGAPAASPTPPSQNSPSASPNVPSGGGSKTVPTVDASSAEAAKMPLSLISSIFVVAAGLYLLPFTTTH